MHPVLLAALAAQRHDELRRAAHRARRGGPRLGLAPQLAAGRRARRSLGWVLVEVGLRWAVDDTAGLERSPG